MVAEDGLNRTGGGRCQASSGSCLLRPTKLLKQKRVLAVKGVF